MRGFLVIVAVLVVAGIALAFYQDWFHLTVNQDKMKEDTEEARESLQDLGKQIRDKAAPRTDTAREKTGTKAAGARTATGRLTKVQAADNRFLMTTSDGEELTVYTDPATKLRLNDQDVKLERLQPEDELQVAYDRDDGKNRATSVTAHRPEAPKLAP